MRKEVIHKTLIKESQTSIEKKVGELLTLQETESVSFPKINVPNCKVKKENTQFENHSRFLKTNRDLEILIQGKKGC